MADQPKTRSSSFDLPQEPDWHRMIAEAAYYLAEKRGFRGQYALDDWLVAEQHVRETISPTAPPEPSMTDKTQPLRTPEPLQQRASASSPAKPASQVPDESSRYSRFAATQAAGDGIQGDARKPDKTVDEKIGANMADRK
jgi:Protein of unknown function (DUF2934)